LAGEFSILAEYEVDDDLALLIARGEGMPRLGIYNLNSDKKKYVPFSWVENPSRMLKIKVGRSTKEYPISSLMEGVANLLEDSAEALFLNPLVWRGVHVLGDLIHVPKAARSDVDLNLIAENKRDTLWYAYTPKRGKWRVLPCFIATDAERGVMSSLLEDGKPWPVPALSIENGALPPTMRNIPLLKEISIANPARWSEFMLPLARAMLLGFSDWSSGGDRLFSEALWKHLPKQNYRDGENLSAIASAGKLFMNKMIAYLRLWPILEEVQSEIFHDAAKELEKRGMKKRERFEMINPSLDDKQFRVTRLVHEETSAVSFGIVPTTRLPGEDDRIISLTGESWDKCLEACSLGGERDPQYTCLSVIGAIETKAWYTRLVECMTWTPRTEEE